MATPKPVRNRRPLDPAAQVQPPVIRVLQAAVIASQVTLMLDQPCSLNGIPAVQDDQSGDQPDDANLLEGNLLVLDYPDNPNVGTILVIPPYDPAVRSYSGGYLLPGSVNVIAGSDGAAALAAAAPAAAPDDAKAPAAVELAPAAAGKASSASKKAQGGSKR